MATYAYDIQNVRLLNGRGTIQRVRLGNCNCIVGTSVHAAMGEQGKQRQRRSKMKCGAM